MSYDKNRMDAVKIRSIVIKLFRRKLISEDQFNAINTDYKDQFYTPNLFVRIGLFIFTLILVNAVLGIFGLAIGQAFDSEVAFGVLCLITSGGLIISLEFFIKTKYHFRSGIDDCLLYMALAFAIAGITLIVGFTGVKIILFLSMAVMILASWRYYDSFVAVLAFICLLALIFLALADFSLGKMIMPFVFFFISAAVAFIANQFNRNDENVYWENSLNTLKITGLLFMYLSLNYLVVREGNRMLNETNISFTENKEYMDVQTRIDANSEKINDSYADSTKQLSEAEMTRLTSENDKLYHQLGEIQSNELSKMAAKGIPLSWLFILTTFLFPFIYIFYGLKNKDRALLLCGLGIMVLTVVTYKYYVHLMPMEYTITISGLALLIISWLAINYLKTNNKVYSYAPDVDDNSDDLLNAEAFIISQTVSTGTSTTPNKGTEFGGGSFGGGGAGGEI